MVPSVLLYGSTDLCPSTAKLRRMGNIQSHAMKCIHRTENYNTLLEAINVLSIEVDLNCGNLARPKWIRPLHFLMDFPPDAWHKTILMMRSVKKINRVTFSTYEHLRLQSNASISVLLILSQLSILSKINGMLS